MSTYPPLEARVSALEHRQIVLGARIEELAENMKASFKQSAEHPIDARFNQVEARLDKLETLLNQFLERLPEKP